jgi:uncharacterized protein YebE (UPF0316 family)
MIFFTSDIVTFILLPLGIFLARVADVSLGTIRIISISKGQKYLAPMLGFVEVLIWLIAVSRIMQNLGNIICYIAYAGGFATGNFVGLYIEKKLAMGTLLVRTITKKDATELIASLKAEGFGVTSVAASGNTGKVHIIYTAIKRSDLRHVLEMVKTFNPKAFYSIEDLKMVGEAIFPPKKSRFNLDHARIFNTKLLRLRYKAK